MSDQYITPEYLASLPDKADSKPKESPLELLAQTCKRIGVETRPVKLPAEAGSDKVKNSENLKSDSSQDSVSFKPYVSPKRHDSISDSSLTNSSSNKSETVRYKSNSSPPSASTTSSPEIIPLSSSDATAKDTQSNADSVRSAQKPSVTSGPILSNGLDLLGKGVGWGECYPSHTSPCKDPSCRDPACYYALLARLTPTPSSGLPPGYLELMEWYKLYYAASGVGSPLSGVSPATPPQLSAYSQLLSAAGAARMRGPYPVDTPRYSPYSRPGYPRDLLGGPTLPPSSLFPPPPGPPSIIPTGVPNPPSIYSLLGSGL